MARNYPADTRGQRVLEELYEKENVAQLQWFLKHWKAKKDNPGKPLSPAAIIETPVPPINEVLPHNLLQKINESKQKTAQKLAETSVNEKPESLKGQDKESTCDMYPPDPQTLRLLFDGISKEGKGRVQYLRERNKLNVEQKFQYPIASSMIYGWGNTALLTNSGPQQNRHGRERVIEESFYRRTGIPFIHCEEMI
ncbi:unnamed protein product [Calicophoron daubneyi]|uniref:Sperm microtubule inner protein 1 C-terminal domain-containing protein n=1 Tax=Calicophoron daubneyi TaxID=300641 RepID=A0AAV2TB49_CALDB